MSLEPVFKNKADTDGPFIVDITFTNRAGPASGAEDRRSFRQYLQDACYEAGVVVGVNVTPDGFQLGFEHPDDYTAVMAIVEPKMIEAERLEMEHLATLLKSYGATAEDMKSFRHFAETGEISMTPEHSRELRDGTSVLAAPAADHDG